MGIEDKIRQIARRSSPNIPTYSRIGMQLQRWRTECASLLLYAFYQ